MNNTLSQKIKQLEEDIESHDHRPYTCKCFKARMELIKLKRKEWLQSAKRKMRNRLREEQDIKVANELVNGLDMDAPLNPLDEGLSLSIY